MRDRFRGRRARVGFLVVAAGAGVMIALPWSREALYRLLTGFYVLGVDLQAMRPWAQDAAITRTPAGHLLVYGWFKKALLQSLPYLGLLSVALACVYRGVRRELFLVTVLAASIWMAPYAYRQWHGGSPINMRYFLPVLPLLAVMAAAALRELPAVHDGPLRRRVLVTAALGVPSFLCGVGVIRLLYAGDPVGVTLAAYVPLALAAVLFVCGGLRLLGPLTWRIPCGKAATATTIAAVTWAATMAFVYDAVYHQARRLMNEQRMEDAARLPADTHVVTATPMIFLPQFKRADSAVTYFTNDRSSQIVTSIEASLDKDRCVVLHQGDWVESFVHAPGFPGAETRRVKHGELAFLAIGKRDACRSSRAPTPTGS